MTPFRAPAGCLQLTLAVLKPDVVANPIAHAQVKRLILDHNFLVVHSRRLQLSREKAREFYAEHSHKFFYDRLVSYMTCGPITAHVLARRDAITMWRALLGPTKVFQTVFQAPNSIRGRFGLTDTRNCAHGSDSNETAHREIQFFFPEFDFQGWYETHEEQFRLNRVEMKDFERFEHVLLQDEDKQCVKTVTTDST